MKNKILKRLMAGVGALAICGAGIFGQVPESSATNDDDMPQPLTWMGAHRAFTGSAVSTSTCDFNGDGKQDIVTSAWMWSRLNGQRSGVAYVIPSGAEPGQLDDSETGVIRIEGLQGQPNMTGFTINCVGDVNGDGIDDIVIGQHMNARAYVVFGSRHNEHVLLDFLGDRGFIIQGDADARDRTGYYAQGLGDLDGDGRAEVGLVSLQRPSRIGQINIIRGRDDISTVYLGSDSPDILATIQGAEHEGISSVAPAGDVNGDGKPDILVGGYVANPDGFEKAAAGMGWVLFGDVRGDIQLGDPDNPINGFMIYGPERGTDRLGISLAPAGDIDDDGYDDIVLGADGGTRGQRSGSVAVVRGSESQETVRTDPDATNGMAVYAGDTDRGWWINGEGIPNGGFGFAISAISPQMSGGHGVILVGAYSANRAYAISTQALTQPVVNVAEVDPEHILIAEGFEPGQRFGRGIGYSHNFAPAGATQSASDIPFGMMVGADNVRDIGYVSVFGIPSRLYVKTAETPPVEPVEKPSQEPSAPAEEPSQEPSQQPSTPSGSADDPTRGSTPKPVQEPDQDAEVPHSEEEPQAANETTQAPVVEVGTAPADKSTSSGNGVLSLTGAQALPLALLAVVLVGGGVLLIANRRREDADIASQTNTQATNEEK